MDFNTEAYHSWSYFRVSKLTLVIFDLSILVFQSPGSLLRCTKTTSHCDCYRFNVSECGSTMYQHDNNDKFRQSFSIFQLLENQLHERKLDQLTIQESGIHTKPFNFEDFCVFPSKRILYVCRFLLIVSLITSITITLALSAPSLGVCFAVICFAISASLP